VEDSNIPLREWLFVMYQASNMSTGRSTASKAGAQGAIVHLCRIDGVWALVKRSRKGGYHCWNRKRLHRYINEIARRRLHKGLPAFVDGDGSGVAAAARVAVAGIEGKRLTYQAVEKPGSVRQSTAGPQLDRRKVTHGPGDDSRGLPFEPPWRRPRDSFSTA